MAKDTNIKIWPDESNAFNSISASLPAYLSPAERVRLEKIRQARKLFDGAHREFFLDGGRTQFFYRRVKGNNNAIAPLYITLNLLRLISMKSSDLLFGETPLINSDNEEQQIELDAIAERSGLHQVCYQAALDASSETDAYLEATVYDGETYIQQIPGDEIWPVGPLMPDGQYREYVRRAVDTVSIAGREAQILLETRYRAGQIERHLYEVNADGNKGRELDLTLWPANGSYEPTTNTGIAWNTVIWIPNLLVRRKAVCDYDGGLLGLQDVVNAKNSQLAYVILRHTQPKLIVDEQLMDDDGKLPDVEVYTKREGQSASDTAGYLTWDAQLDAAQKDRAFAVNQLLVQAECSPVLLGMKEGSAPDAYRKVRLEAFNSITKAARKAVYWTEGIRTAAITALMLNGTLPGKRYEESQISVQLRDGIPADETDEATRLATLKTADIVDDQYCLEQLLDDPTEVEAVMARKAAKAAAMTPTVLLGEEPPTDSGQVDANQMIQAMEQISPEMAAAMRSGDMNEMAAAMQKIRTVPASRN